MSLMPAPSDDNRSLSLRNALEYVSYGWYVGPLYEILDDGRCACPRKDCGNSRGKHPIYKFCPHGVYNFSNDPETLRQWFTERPNAGVGVDLARSGLVMVGPDSPEWNEEFKKRGLPYGAAIAESGGGEGHVHYFYSRPEDAPLERKNQPEKYDVMSAGIASLRYRRRCIHLVGSGAGWCRQRSICLAHLRGRSRCSKQRFSAGGGTGRTTDRKRSG